MNINGLAGSDPKVGLDRDPGDNARLRFIDLQFKYALANKEGGHKLIDQLEKDHTDQQTLNAVAKQLGELKAQGSAGTPTSLSQDTVKILRNLGIQVNLTTEGACKADRLMKLDALLEKAKKDGSSIRLTKEDAEGLGGLFNEGDVVNLSDISVKIKEVKNGDHDNHAKITLDNLDTLIQSIQSKVESLGSRMQQTTMEAQDLLAKFSSFLGGVNSAAQKDNQVLGETTRMR